MKLTDTIQEEIFNLNNKPDMAENLKLIKKKLKKKGFKKIVHDISKELCSSECDEISRVWEKLDDLFNKKRYKWNGDYGDTRDCYEIIKEISSIDNIEGVLESLAEVGYKLEIWYDPNSVTDWSTYRIISQKDLDTIKILKENELYKKLNLVFKSLKKLSYKNINKYKTRAQSQLYHLIKISGLEGDVQGAIYILASNNWQINKKSGIDRDDIESIAKIAKKAQEEKIQGTGGSHIFLYEKGNLEVFQDYFNNLKSEDQSYVIESILEHEAKTEPENPRECKEIKEWLEQNYTQLIKKATFHD